MHGIVNGKHEPEHSTDLRCESSTEQHMTICMTIILKSNKRTFIPQMVNEIQRRREPLISKYNMRKENNKYWQDTYRFCFFSFFFCATALYFGKVIHQYGERKLVKTNPSIKFNRLDVQSSRKYLIMAK